jgi:hypothetical protein
MPGEEALLHPHHQRNRLEDGDEAEPDGRRLQSLVRKRSGVGVSGGAAAGPERVAETSGQHQ